MLLVIDLSDLNLKFYRTDIRVNNGNLTVGRLMDKICAGIEEIGKEKLLNRNSLTLLNDGEILNPTQEISKLSLNDWDTLYLVRRK